MTTNNETTEDGVSSTGQGAGGAINLSSRPSSVPETTTNQNVQASGNSDVRHTPNIVEADSQEEQVVSGGDLLDRVSVRSSVFKRETFVHNLDRLYKKARYSPGRWNEF